MQSSQALQNCVTTYVLLLVCVCVGEGGGGERERERVLLQILQVDFA